MHALSACYGTLCKANKGLRQILSGLAKGYKISGTHKGLLRSGIIQQGCRSYAVCVYATGYVRLKPLSHSREDNGCRVAESWCVDPVQLENIYSWKPKQRYDVAGLSMVCSRNRTSPLTLLQRKTDALAFFIPSASQLLDVRITTDVVLCVCTQRYSAGVLVSQPCAYTREVRITRAYSELHRSARTMYRLDSTSEKPKGSASICEAHPRSPWLAVGFTRGEPRESIEGISHSYARLTGTVQLWSYASVLSASGDGNTGDTTDYAVCEQVYIQCPS
jgi:hypothetical protein